MSCSTYFFIVHSSSNFKSRFLERIGVNNLYIARSNINLSVLRYLNIFDEQLTISDVNNKIWTPEFDPLDPDSGWGSRVHTTVFPLLKTEGTLIPYNARGYLLDSTCNATYSPENHVSEAYTLLYNKDVRKGDICTTSVYCFVSEDFDGYSAGYAVAWSAINEGLVNGITRSFYDLNNKGTWQKLELNFSCQDGIVPIYITFNKKNVVDLSDLSGHVIFAYPDLKLYNDTILTINSNLSNKFNLNKVYNLSIFANFLFIYSSVSKFADSILIQLKDSTYYPMKFKINILTPSNSFEDQRISRWKFAIQIFKKEYNWKQKIFGGGFKFLNWYGYVFLNDKTKTDYPHNPFLHILLYSGIVGVLLYILLLYKVFYYYIKYIKEYYLFFVFFLITYFFTFFSGGNPFDPPIMGFFMMLPFFIHYIHEKEKPEVEKQKFKVKIQGLVFKIKHFRNNS